MGGGRHVNNYYYTVVERRNIAGYATELVVNMYANKDVEHQT